VQEALVERRAAGQNNAMAAPPFVILTGAGISRESGLPTFRDADGIWARVRLEDVATPEAFARTPDRVHAFYDARRRALRDPAVQPNAAHLALAELDRRWPGELLLVTQNIDDLHERAGSRRLLHMHGELLKARCAACENIAATSGDLAGVTICNACGARGTLRPHVVWFGEMPLAMDEIGARLAACRLFVAIGTSGTVYPAAGFVAEARRAGAHTVELNLDPATGRSDFAEAIAGPASQIVPALVARLLAEHGAACGQP
jgi:NAD-dependent deacetylase